MTKNERVPKFPAGGVHLFCMQRRRRKKKGKKERKKASKKKGEREGRREKKSSPSITRDGTVSADFHLHKFSYILVKIIAGAEECSCSVEAEERKS